MSVLMKQNLIITCHVYKYVITSLKIILIECVRGCIRERTIDRDKQTGEK